MIRETKASVNGKLWCLMKKKKGKRNLKKKKKKELYGIDEILVLWP